MGGGVTRSKPSIWEAQRGLEHAMASIQGTRDKRISENPVMFEKMDKEESILKKKKRELEAIYQKVTKAPSTIRIILSIIQTLR